MTRVFTRSTFLFAFLACALGAGIARGQSTNQNFPTPVTSNEISGTIKARDVGDARLTSYFYQFDGAQGDVFVNVVARNFAGDIDIFTLNGLRPLTKIVVYGDLGESETGRVIYLRKSEKMILRVQGRTPGDEAATFRIKFAGSFVASTMTETAEPTLPSLTARNESGIRVNSVGTIVEVIPKATPTPADTSTAAEIRNDQNETAKEPTDAASERNSGEKTGDLSGDTTEKKLEVVVTENAGGNSETKSAATPKSRRRTRGRPPAKTAPPVKTESAEVPAEGATVPKTSRRGRVSRAKAPTEKTPDPLENVNLVILFKDGRAIERPMSEVLRFSVDRGVLTVISKDGSIGRYPMLDVAKVTIE
ncbi:MAG TPA: hypothetical protein VMZ26_15470 [Pyrinomonadaceae bacterium]|nr:hypothetical protein [Pyrinomonadaceae bacterium]